MVIKASKVAAITDPVMLPIRQNHDDQNIDGLEETEKSRFDEVEIGSIQRTCDSAKNAPMAKAITLYLVVLIPMDSAAISSSRMEMQALPWEDRIKLFIRTTDAAVNIKSQVQFVNRGIPFNPLRRW